MKFFGKEHFSAIILFSLTILVALMGLFGFLHHPIAQRLWYPKKMALAEPSSTDLDHLRAQILRQTSQTAKELAPLRPALGLKLEHTTMREAANWLLDKGLHCEHSVRGYAYLKCRQVNSSVLQNTVATMVDELDLSFNSHGRLIAVSLLRRNLSSSQTKNLLEQISADLNKNLGHPTKVVGNINAKSFEKPMNSVSIEYSYSNYLAKLTASNLPWSGVVLYEQYMSY